MLVANKMTECHSARVVRAAFLLLLTVALCACSGLTERAATRRDYRGGTSQACLDLFEAANRQIESAGVVDGQAHRVPRFPFLRVDRYLAARVDGVRGEAESAAWLRHAAALDEKGGRRN